jgi:colanic acid biosynthesis glycosyl transferase WcaI
VIGLNYSPEPNGIAPYTAGLATGLTARGWAVHVCAAVPHYPQWKAYDGYSSGLTVENLNGVHVRRIHPYIPQKPTGLKRLAMEITFGIGAVFSRWNRPDVVVLVSPALFSTAIAMLRAKLSPSRPRVAIWVQDLYSAGVSETGAMGTSGARLMAWAESAILRRADAVVVIHERFRRTVASKLNVKEARISVVRNWTHIAHIAVNRAEFRSKLGWGEEIVVLHAGNMGAKQALENVVEAARAADIQQAKIRFVLLGDGNQRESLRRLAVGINRIDFMDSLGDRDFQGAMAAADILLVNEKEGVAEMAVPSKLTSYFAAARPVLAATDSGSITAEEIEAAGAGVRVNAGDPTLLLEAALRLGSDPTLMQLLGASGAAFQRSTLSPDVAISHYADMITSLEMTRGH